MLVPVRLRMTAGQVGDALVDPEIIAGLHDVRIVADKGYDSARMRDTAAASGGTSCIPRIEGRKEPAPFHKGYYRLRHHVENFFQRIKRYRRVATRYEKLAHTFFNFVLLAAALDWINNP